MYRNVLAEMKRQGLTGGNMAEELGITPGTFSQKVNGNYPFTFREAVKVKEVLKTDLPLEVLFEEFKEEAV